jgi:hypothetical protein
MADFIFSYGTGRDLKGKEVTTDAFKWKKQQLQRINN